MFSLRDQKRYGSVGVTLIVLFSAMAAFAAGLVSDTSSGGQGVVVTDGYTVTDIVYGNSINTNSNDSSTDITSVTFKLYRDGEGSQTPVSGSDTTVYVQLLPSANWTQCSVTVSPNVTCVPVSSQRISYAALTGMNIVAYDKATGEEPVSPQGASGEVTVTGGDNIYDIYIGPETWRVHEFRTVGESTFTVSGGSLDVEYLVVAGGGGGGSRWGGGGGGGGLLTNVGGSSLSLAGAVYTVTVGAGGSAATAGSSSTIASVTAEGGGYGGSNLQIGGNGGSGGGGNANGDRLGGLGTSGQGNAGGTGRATGVPGGGGGGGAGAAGVNALTGGDGGDGIQSSITGIPVYYAGGGGGGINTGSVGGLGGGADGVGNLVAGLSGTDGLGGGGGGTGGPNTLAGGDGGDGIVIIRYKVSDEFSPLSLSPALWLDASDTSTITESGGSVSQWDDKSGNGYHVTQATGVSQPTTGSATLNDLNVLSFDGGDFLQNATVPSLTSPYTTFVVWKFGQLTASAQYVLDDGSAPARTLLSTISTTSLRTGANAYPVIATGMDTSTTYLADWVINGASSEAKVNGASSGTVNMGTYSRGGVTVGAGANGLYALQANGLVAEVLLFAGAMSDANRLLVRTYLADKWGIAL